MSKEFLVNSYSGQWQQSPDIARLKNGDFVVVWQSFLSEVDPDIDVYYIGAQRFSASGKTIGKEFIVDLDVAVDGGASTSPSVTALKDGGFAVGWENSKDGILGSTDVYTRAFDANGKERSDSVRVHAKSGEDQKVPELSATKNGYFVSYTDYDGSKGLKFENVYLQRFDNDGDRVGKGHQINQQGKLDQQCTASAELSNGATVVIWDSEKTGPDAVSGRIYGSDGQADTKEFTISDENGQISDAISPDSSIDVAALSKGRFVATWYETKLNGDRDTTFEIHGRIFGQNGKPVGGEFKVGGDEDGVSRHSAVIGLEDGGFVVAWDEPGESFKSQEAFARVFDDKGQGLGSKFKLHPESGRSDQEFPELAALKNGGFFAVYESEFLDGDYDAIAGRLFDLGSKGADAEALSAAGVYKALGGDDDISGAGGRDDLFGGRGADTLAGAGGGDVVSGGHGRDLLAGGAGGDRFIFAGAVGADGDRIRDFEASEDWIDLSRLDADAGAPRDQAFRFIGDRGFTGEAGELRYDGKGLFGDVDGDGGADFRIEVSGLEQDSLVL